VNDGNTELPGFVIMAGKEPATEKELHPPCIAGGMQFDAEF